MASLTPSKGIATALAGVLAAVQPASGPVVTVPPEKVVMEAHVAGQYAQASTTLSGGKRLAQIFIDPLPYIAFQTLEE